MAGQKAESDALDRETLWEVIHESMEIHCSTLPDRNHSESVTADVLAFLSQRAADASTSPAECGAHIATAHPRISQSCALPVLHEGDHSPSTSPEPTSGG